MDDAQTVAIDGAQAEFAVAHLMELSPDTRGCALLDAAGRALAATGEAGRWAEAGAAFLEAGDAALAASGEQGGSAEQLHVGTEDGEAFAVRHAGLAMVAVAERFTLASLMLFDMRTILRDLAAGEVVDRRAPEDEPAANEAGGADAA